MTMHLFFYGVLIDGLASPSIRALLAGLGPGRPATTRGALFAIPDPRGWYPVLLPGEGEVCGMLHEAGTVDLAALDRFEGVDPADPPAGEYRREPVEVVPEGGGPLMADAYLYNRARAPEVEPIPHGDFARWLRETGHAPLAG